MILAQDYARVVVGQDIFVAIKLEKGGVCTHKEVVCVVFVCADLINYSVLHLLPVRLHWTLLQELCDWDFAFQPLQLLTLVN